ncbi:hypothetical protein BGW36DRAFT_361707 [Talaromyces proteolyticus]|uniref:Cyanovirin-N domain-containing protein n=1 Tax=Talaromyces proteolyticus TaxID=1131652 RepID=A0AAD4KMR0_9EURO|nr:uncharacterized protein BGW36DRAFT_361707 [Talaromyces proteolyticus]KAH8693875.1 hypothetical protein BGW36DRAFT_361707 [Talaromyces proteolyticus]
MSLLSVPVSLLAIAFHSLTVAADTTAVTYSPYMEPSCYLTSGNISIPNNGSCYALGKSNVQSMNLYQRVGCDESELELQAIFYQTPTCDGEPLRAFTNISTDNACIELGVAFNPESVYVICVQDFDRL